MDKKNPVVKKDSSELKVEDFAMHWDEYQKTWNELLEDNFLVAKALHQSEEVTFFLVRYLMEENERREETLRVELRECIDEVAQDLVEFEAEELKRRFDRVFDRHSKQIEMINAWRERFET